MNAKNLLDISFTFQYILMEMLKGVLMKIKDIFIKSSIIIFYFIFMINYLLSYLFFSL